MNYDDVKFVDIPHSRSKPTIDFAQRFAFEAHKSIDQRRKFTNEPYIVHPQEVALLVASVVPDDFTSISAAFLHDVVEDTPVTVQEIADAGFRHPIAFMVRDLTNVAKRSDGNRATRKKINREHLADKSPEVKTVKLADIISNTKDIMLHDPKFGKMYLEEKALMLEVLTEGNPELYKRAYEIIHGGL